MGDNYKVVKEELKEALRQELSTEPAPEEEAHGEDEELEAIERPRPSWEQFLFTWDNSPAVFFEEVVNRVVAEKLGIEVETVKNSRLVPAIAYIPAYYLWPYVMNATAEDIPEPLRPLSKSISVLFAAVLSKKLGGFKGGGHAGQALPAPE